MTRKTARIVFGTVELLELINKTNPFHSTHFIQSLKRYIKEQNPALKQYIGPITIYSGTGWNTTLVPSFGLTLKGIARAFQLRQYDVPVLSNPAEFEQFVAQTRAGEKTVAVVESSVIGGKKDGSGLHVYTVLYDKQRGSEKLYVYDSADDGYERFRRYFGTNFSLLVRDKSRQHYGDGSGTCFAYAIRDACMLKAALAKHRFSGSCDNEIYKKGGLVGNKGCFSLPLEFRAEIGAFRKTLFKELIVDALTLRPEETEQPLGCVIL